MSKASCCSALSAAAPAECDPATTIEISAADRM